MAASSNEKGRASNGTMRRCHACSADIGKTFGESTSDNRITCGSMIVGGSARVACI